MSYARWLVVVALAALALAGSPSRADTVEVAVTVPAGGIAPGQAGPGPLPRSGLEVGPILLAACLLAVVGLLLMWACRRGTERSAR